MRVVLLFPAPRRDSEDPSCALLPVGLLGLAAVLRARGHRVLVIHTGGFGEQDTLRAVRRFRPGRVGLSCFTYQRRLVARARPGPASRWRRYSSARAAARESEAELARALDRLPNWREARRLLRLMRRRDSAPDQDAG